MNGGGEPDLIWQQATSPYMDLPGFRLHPLKGQMKGFLGRDRSGKLARDFPF